MTSSNPVLFDSNILVWAHDTKNLHHQRAKELIETAIVGKLNVFLAQQNILEFFSVITNPKRLSLTLSLLKTLKIANSYRRCFKIISPKENTLELTLTFINDFKIRKAKVFDAYLVATMITNGVYTIYTANDQDFKKFAHQIKIVNPFKSKREG